MANLSKHAFGSKANIETAKQEGKIDAYDVLFLDNGETGWIDKDGETQLATPRTQTPIVVNGVTGLGIADKETIPAGKSLEEIVKMLVQKPIPATYAKPTVSLANNGGQGAGAVEAGTSVTPKIRATFNKNDAGDLTNLVIKKGGSIVKEGIATPVDYAGEAIVVGDETVSFSASATYKEGAIKNNNLGNPSPDGHIPAGTITSANYSFIGQRNLFYGTGVGTKFVANSANIRGLNNKKLNPTAGHTFTISVSAGQQFVVIAYPASVRDLTKVHYVEGNDPNLAKNFVKSQVNVADARGGSEGEISYKCYVLQLSTPAQATMTLNVTI